MRGNRKPTPNERMRDHHKNMLTGDLKPRQIGTTCAEDPNAPMWEALINIDGQCPLKEWIRAETKAAAKRYVLNKYNHVKSVLILGRVTGR